MTGEPAHSQSAPPRIPHIKGVRASPGGVVQFQELQDGWATFPDFGGRIRRWQRWGCTVAVASVIGATACAKAGDHSAGVALAGVFVAVMLLVMSTGTVSNEQSFLARWRLRRDSELRAGGRDMLRAAIAHAGRAETAAKMTVLVSSLGRTDPVYTFRRIRRARVRNGAIWASVRLELDNDTTLTYRVLGWRAPGRLARAFGPPRVAAPVG